MITARQILAIEASLTRTHATPAITRRLADPIADRIRRAAADDYRAMRARHAAIQAAIATRSIMRRTVL